MSRSLVRGLYPRRNIRGAFPPLGSTLLPTDITLNSVTVSASWVYSGADVTTSDWEGAPGETLTVGGSGATVAEETFFNKTANVSKSNATGRYVTSDTTHDVGTNDMVLEAIIYTGTVSARYISTRDTGNGWLLYRGAANRVYFLAIDGGAATSIATIADNTWAHILVFVDSGGNQSIYINGSLHDTDAAVSGSISGGDGIGIHANPDGLQQGDGWCAWAALWHSAAWLDTSAQTDWAADRYRLLQAGADPLLPTTITLNSVDVAAKAVYEARFATASDWAANVGDDLGITGTGHTVAEDTFFAQTALVASAAGNGTWAASSTGFDIGTGDFVIELILRGGTTGTYYASNFSGAGHGWTIFRSGANQVKLYSTDGTIRQVGPGALTDGAWGHVIIIGDRDVGMRLYLNGVQGGVQATSTTGALSSANVAAILGDAAGATRSDGSVAWAAVWESTGWLDAADQAAWVTARHALLT